VCVRERWLSRRAVFLHLGFLLFVPVCIAATWWQITRAEDGNGLSYLYSFEWPVFAILGVYFWWMFLHTDYNAVGLKGMHNQALSPPALPDDVLPAPHDEMPAPHDEMRAADDVVLAPHDAGAGAPRELDPELAAYNDRLAALAENGAKTWRKPEVPVVRRSR